MRHRGSEEKGVELRTGLHSLGKSRWLVVPAFEPRSAGFHRREDVAAREVDVGRATCLRSTTVGRSKVRREDCREREPSPIFGRFLFACWRLVTVRMVSQKGVFGRTFDIQRALSRHQGLDMRSETLAPLPDVNSTSINKLKNAYLMTLH
jgi:hypothetical protein